MDRAYLRAQLCTHKSGNELAQLPEPTSNHSVYQLQASHYDVPLTDPGVGCAQHSRASVLVRCFYTNKISRDSRLA
jgi:hypothetical protein